jgi:nicotinamide mononucleotide transporter
MNFAALEWIASALGIVSIALLVRQNLWCWPTGIGQVTLYIFIFYDARLYSNMGLQVAFVVLQAYGWIHWIFGGEARDTLPVTRIRTPGALLSGAATIAGTAGLGYGMNTYTDAALAYWDAATTAMSLVAQYLQARKIIECWLLWIAVDVLAIGIFAYQGLYVTTVLYAVFLGLASWGYRAWGATLRPQPTL